MGSDRVISRRDLLAGAGAAAVGIGVSGFPAIVRAESLRADRVRIGMIGVGGRGNDNMRAHMKNIVAICDVDATHLAKAKATVEKANPGVTVATYADYRKLLEDKNVDAVLISTPDHWHALTTIDSCMAGKDVYCEKPMTLTIAEGRAMVDAGRRFNRVIQVGSQQRSDPRFKMVCDIVRSGRLGKINTVKVGIPGVNMKGPAVPDSAPPPELDYDMWLGPAPKRPYNVNHVHYNFRFFWDYSGGQMTNWGAHHIDIAQWGLGMDDSGPISAEGTATYTDDKLYEVPKTFEAIYTYANGTKLIVGSAYPSGTTFEGEKGTIFVTRGRATASDPSLLVPVEGPTGPANGDGSRSHAENWLDCIASRKRPVADVEIGHRSVSICHLGNIAIRTQKKLVWDPKAEKITNDKEAAKMVSRPYRSPWHAVAKSSD